MTEETVSADRLNRILNAVDTIEASLGIFARKQSLSRERTALIRTVVISSSGGS
ncbi:hypothetical protein HYG81_18655 [Natrinema zhouii]|uniref:hypothetical protein n=1 Tax=Natrinema zhouii TaxID=1710539 RepID=UPI001CFF5C18|nr:hypothetical protein [Natrinema zhouii]UHQ97957.1 hypothetical protein HYG81_18655 [Natrinema zhouii]